MHRVVVFLTVIGLVAALVAPSTAAASNRPIEYLALGDSLAFGYSPLVNPSNTADFVGYPDFVAAAVRDTLTSAACPGETSSHLVDLTGTDNGCGFFRALFQLHTTYTGSQLAFADEFLSAHPKTQLVTIDIGANDMWVLVNSCGGRDAVDVNCVLTRMPAMLANLATNLDTIYGHLRVDDGYQHKIVALTFPSIDYADPALTGVVQQIDAVVAARTVAWGGIVADGFGAWYAASAPYGGSPCAAGLQIATSTSPLTCDDHPSPTGHRLLAEAIIQALRPE